MPLISIIVFFAASCLLVFLLWNYNWRIEGSVFLVPVGLYVLAIISTVTNNEFAKNVRNFNKS